MTSSSMSEPSDAFMEGVFDGVLNDLPPRPDVRLVSAVLCLVWEKTDTTVDHDDHLDRETQVEVTTWGSLDGHVAIGIVTEALDRRSG